MTKVNIDQFVLDSKKREWFWNYRRRHKLAFFKNRVQWYLYPNIRWVSSFPLHVDFEVSALCNMKCQMCFRQHRNKKDDGLMDIKLFKKGIDECVSYGLYSIRMSWRGESTIHPHFIEMVSYAKAKGIKEVSFLTNGLKIRGDYIRDLVLSGVDYISISVDGVYENYNRIRKPAKFKELLIAIKELHDTRNKIGNGFPKIKINTILTQIDGHEEEYYKIFSPLADIISFNPDYDYSEEASSVSPDHICQYPYQRLTVKWDGIVPMCISDWDIDVILGDLNKDTLFDIWHGDTLKKIREDHKKGEINNYLPCSKCHRPVTAQVGNKRV